MVTELGAYNTLWGIETINQRVITWKLKTVGGGGGGAVILARDTVSIPNTHFNTISRRCPKRLSSYGVYKNGNDTKKHKNQSKGHNNEKKKTESKHNYTQHIVS